MSFLNLSGACSLSMTLLVTRNGSRSLNCNYATTCSLNAECLT